MMLWKLNGWRRCAFSNKPLRYGWGIPPQGSDCLEVAECCGLTYSIATRTNRGHGKAFDIEVPFEIENV